MVLISQTSSPRRRVSGSWFIDGARRVNCGARHQSVFGEVSKASEGGIKSTPSANKQTNKHIHISPYLFINVLDCTLPPRLPPFFCRRFNKLTGTLSAPGCRFISALPANLSLGKWKCMCWARPSDAGPAPSSLPPPSLEPRELLLHKMIIVVFGSIHLDYTDRNALIMICGRRSSEVCQKTLNVKSPAVVSNYQAVTHTHLNTHSPSSPL